MLTRKRASAATQETAAFIWDQFAPYHMDRVTAVARMLGARLRVIGIEVAAGSTQYAWERSKPTTEFEKITLYPDKMWEQTRWYRVLFRVLKILIREKVSYVFVTNYNRIDTFCIATIARLLGRRAYIMTCSKFDDFPRRATTEFFKQLALIAYSGALASGERTAAYLTFLGLPPDRVFVGQNSVSVARIRRLAGSSPAPGGVEYAQRHFTVIARFVPKKNLPIIVDAYSRYRALEQENGRPARGLVICGDGPQRDMIAAMVADRHIDGVDFRGFVQEDSVARVLASSLALILMSEEEQWGNVINEAVAMGVPIFCSDNAGARDALVRVGVNGYVLSPRESQGLAYLMCRLASERHEWERFANGSLDLAAEGDVARFAEGVNALCLAAARRGSARKSSRLPAGLRAGSGFRP